MPVFPQNVLELAPAQALAADVEVHHITCRSQMPAFETLGSTNGTNLLPPLLFVLHGEAYRVGGQYSRDEMDNPSTQLDALDTVWPRVIQPAMDQGWNPLLLVDAVVATSQPARYTDLCRVGAVFGSMRIASDVEHATQVQSLRALLDRVRERTRDVPWQAMLLLRIDMHFKRTLPLPAPRPAPLGPLRVPWAMSGNPNCTVAPDELKWESGDTTCAAATDATRVASRTLLPGSPSVGATAANLPERFLPLWLRRPTPWPRVADTAFFIPSSSLQAFETVLSDMASCTDLHLLAFTYPQRGGQLDYLVTDGRWDADPEKVCARASQTPAAQHAGNDTHA